MRWRTRGEGAGHPDWSGGGRLGRASAAASGLARRRSRRHARSAACWCRGSGADGDGVPDQPEPPGALAVSAASARSGSEPRPVARTDDHVMRQIPMPGVAATLASRRPGWLRDEPTMQQHLLRTESDGLVLLHRVEKTDVRAEQPSPGSTIGSAVAPGWVRASWASSRRTDGAARRVPPMRAPVTGRAPSRPGSPVASRYPHLGDIPAEHGEVPRRAWPPWRRRSRRRARRPPAVRPASCPRSPSSAAR